MAHTNKTTTYGIHVATKKDGETQKLHSGLDALLATVAIDKAHLDGRVAEVWLQCEPSEMLLRVPKGFEV